MKTTIWICILGLSLFSTQLLAYGSSSSSKSCAKPSFSEFNPVDQTEVEPQSTFSFLASSGTNPKSIVVDIKKQPVDITVTPKGQGYQVTGKLPNDLAGTVARINITAESPSNCKGNDGWLIKISGQH
jgi:hypothetical protein